MIQWHKADISNRVYCNLPGGKKKSMPRYYRDKMYTAEERGFLKGEFEKKNRELDEAAARHGKLQTARQREQAVKAAFKAMETEDTKFKI
ncbi:MAG: replication initiator protein [Microviridae sp.]|nr:MAG: replication initiator protein [Microviridae sp.]